MRDNFTAAGLNAYLDTAAGVMLTAQYGSRQAAAKAMAVADQTNRQWRRAVAVTRAENHPDVFPSVDDAMIGIADPQGGFAAQLSGTTDEIVKAVRRVDPSRGCRNLGEAPQDGEPTSVMYQDDAGYLHPADTRPPWRRD